MCVFVVFLGVFVVFLGVFVVVAASLMQFSKFLGHPGVMCVFLVFVFFFCVYALTLRIETPFVATETMVDKFGAINPYQQGTRRNVLLRV